MQPQLDNKFAEILIEAVDHGLSILGESARKSIYFHLEKDHGFKREQFSTNVGILGKGLHTIFGAGANVIEKMILQNLYSKLGLKFNEKQGFNFSDYVQEAEKIWQTKHKSQEETLHTTQQGECKAHLRISTLFSTISQLVLSTGVAQQTAS